MGLLEKALQYYNLEAEKKTAGLLAGAALYSKTLQSRGLLPTGLLAKAQRFLRESGTESLYSSAGRFGEAHIPRGMKVGKIGLLEKALRFAAEGASVEEETFTEVIGAPELEKVAAAAPAEELIEEVVLPEADKIAAAAPAAPVKKVKPRKAAPRIAPKQRTEKEEEKLTEAEPLPQIFEELLAGGEGENDVRYGELELLVAAVSVRGGIGGHSDHLTRTETLYPDQGEFCSLSARWRKDRLDLVRVYPTSCGSPTSSSRASAASRCR